MKLAFFAHGLCAAAFLLSLAACGGGGSDATGRSATALAALPAQADGPADGNVPTPSLRCAP
jgi:hypothetical protein